MNVIWRSRPLLCSMRLPGALTRVCAQWALNEKEGTAIRKTNCVVTVVLKGSFVELTPVTA